MFGMLALIVVVLSGLKIAFGGGLQPWEVVRVIIGIWIPWVMLQFYTTNIPGDGFSTFPHMIVAGGNWINLTCSLTTLFPPFGRELTKLFNQLSKAQDAAVEVGRCHWDILSYRVSSRDDGRLRVLRLSSSWRL